MNYDLIVTRHPGTLHWLGKYLFPSEHLAHVCPAALEWSYFGPEPGSAEWDDARGGPAVYRSIPVMAEVTPDDVRGKHVVGNLPLHLAALAASVTAVEFAGPPPRGREYGAEEMEAAGARLVKYHVRTAPADSTTQEL